MCEMYNELTEKDENDSYILVTGIENQNDIRMRYEEYTTIFERVESLKSHSEEVIVLFFCF